MIDLDYLRGHGFDDAADEIERLREALKWYAQHLGNCNRYGPEGNAARDALAKDLGQKAAAALAEEGQRND